MKLLLANLTSMVFLAAACWLVHDGHEGFAAVAMVAAFTGFHTYGSKSDDSK